MSDNSFFSRIVRGSLQIFGRLTSFSKKFFEWLLGIAFFVLLAVFLDVHSALSLFRLESEFEKNVGKGVEKLVAEFDFSAQIFSKLPGDIDLLVTGLQPSLRYGESYYIKGPAEEERLLIILTKIAAGSNGKATTEISFSYRNGFENPEVDESYMIDLSLNGVSEPLKVGSHRYFVIVENQSILGSATLSLARSHAHVYKAPLFSFLDRELYMPHSFQQQVDAAVSAKAEAWRRTSKLYSKLPNDIQYLARNFQISLKKGSALKLYGPKRDEYVALEITGVAESAHGDPVALVSFSFHDGGSYGGQNILFKIYVSSGHITKELRVGPWSYYIYVEDESALGHATLSIARRRSARQGSIPRDTRIDYVYGSPFIGEYVAPGGYIIERPSTE